LARACGAASLLLLLASVTAALGQISGEAPPAPVAAPRRVLILSSFGSDFALFSRISSDFRSELTRKLGQPLDFFEVPIDLARFVSVESQAPFADYLSALFASRRLDLVVTLGGPATRFGQTFRSRLFPGVPVLYAAVDGRFLAPKDLTPLDATIAVNNDPPASVEAILRLLPDTREIAVVLGDSPLERFWRDEIGQLFSRFEGRVRFTWLNGLSLDEIRARLAALPPRSAVYFVLMLVDGAGVPHSQERALAAVRQASSAPVFGVFDVQVGQGAVGGPSMPMSQVGVRAAKAAVRIFAGAAPSTVRYPPMTPTLWSFDARELAYWKIPRSRLPAGSEVRFEAQSPWPRYRWEILGGVGLIGLQSGLIAVLVVQRRRRRTAENEVRSLHGRLLTASEQERRRLARELHDDVTQRIARLAIDSAQIERLGPGAEGAETLHAMRDELVRLGRDVHALSRRLHPSILDDLGLVEAIRSEAERVADAGGLELELRFAAESVELGADASLCLFRVAQEALRNVGRHARARRIEVDLASRQGGIEMTVRDDGVGFDPAETRQRPGLGQVSMRERLHLIGGRLSVESALGRGTTVRAWAPHQEERA